MGAPSKQLPEASICNSTFWEGSTVCWTARKRLDFSDFPKGPVTPEPAWLLHGIVGSGAQILSGERRARHPYFRPLLGVSIKRECSGQPISNPWFRKKVGSKAEAKRNRQ